MKTLGKLSLGLAAVGLVQAASAAVLVNYSFTGADNPTRSTATVVGTDVTASTFTFGAGVTANSYSTSTGTSTFTAPASVSMVSNVLTEAISATSTDYVGFTLTPASGKVFNLDNISFSYTYNTNGTVSITTESANLSLRSSVDNYATNIATFTKGAVSGIGNGWATTGSISLTGISFQSLTGVTFRLFAEDNVNSSAIAVRLDQFVVNGSVVDAPSSVPEPSTTALLAAVGIMGFAASRRKRRA